MSISIERGDDDYVSILIRYRRKLPVPRYWLRRSAVISLFVLIMIGGATGRIPSLYRMFGPSPVRIAAFVEGKPDRVLMQMVAEGQIRPARQSDIDQWLTIAQLSKEDRANQSLYTDHAYVVLEQIALPGDMHGAHSRDFYIPADVPAPRGEMAHNSYYFLKSGTCVGSGTGCGR